MMRAALAEPDLILLDIVMPGLDGFEACRRLKSDADTRDVPVIFMTGLSDAKQIVSGFAVGGVDYIDRNSVVEGKRVDLGGRRIIKKKHKKTEKASHLDRQDCTVARGGDGG